MDPKKKVNLRKRRHFRLRKKVVGTSERPRIAVFKSLKHFYAQAIDDSKSVTLFAANSLEKDLRAGHGGSGTAVKVAELLVDKAKKAGVNRVVLDHGGFGYRGKIKLFADALRKGGLEF